jgi:DNA replication initiation complex subunit (GINS family)
MTNQLVEQDSKDTITITYDTLFEILRNEKTKEDLQKLHSTFFNDVVSYLNEKQNNLNENKEQKSLFESDEREKTVHQIGNIKKILKDIYERRERKIMSMAINKSRFSSSIMDTSSLLAEEKVFYELMVSLLDSQRERILSSLLSGKAPELKKPEIILTDQQDFQPANNLFEEKKEELNVSTKLVRFLSPVPQFMGLDMREYGPYEEEGVAKLPEEIANLLIQKERAEEIKEN